MWLTLFKDMAAKCTNESTNTLNIGTSILERTADISQKYWHADIV